MEAEVLVGDVQRVETRSGKTRWVLTDDAGKEYTTFRPRIGEEASAMAAAVGSIAAYWLIRIARIASRM